MANVDKSKCAKYRDPIVVGVHEVEINNKTKTFTVYDTKSATAVKNSIPTLKVNELFEKLGYEGYQNEDNYWRVRKI